LQISAGFRYNFTLQPETTFFQGVLGDVNKLLIEESLNKSKNAIDIGSSSQCQFLQLPKHPEVKRVCNSYGH